ncbi:hypothetical protein [Prosthecobacter sp.]|nr:hypothetical protein [Prosthecobacter sp.]MDI1314162.1 hypothetical protein [Prosthecobacter sp.]
MATSTKIQLVIAVIVVAAISVPHRAPSFAGHSARDKGGTGFGSARS